MLRVEKVFCTDTARAHGEIGKSFSEKEGVVMHWDSKEQVIHVDKGNDRWCIPAANISSFKFKGAEAKPLVEEVAPLAAPFAKVAEEDSRRRTTKKVHTKKVSKKRSKK